jgi:hypothetical protein
MVGTTSAPRTSSKMQRLYCLCQHLRRDGAPTMRIKVLPCLIGAKKSNTEILSKYILKRSSLYKFSNHLSGSLFGKNTQPIIANNASIIKDKNLADSVVSVYNNNITIIESLAQQYGFEVLFYWQPNLFDKQHLTAYEKTALKSPWENKNSRNFHTLVKTSLQKSAVIANNQANFINLSEVFKDTKTAIFIDPVHIGEVGNQQIATAMVKDILPLIKL